MDPSLNPTLMHGGRASALNNSIFSEPRSNAVIVDSSKNLPPTGALTNVLPRLPASFFITVKVPSFPLTEIFPNGISTSINPIAIGGDYGGKGSPMDIPLAYFLAVRTRRPIKMVMDTVEEFSAANPRHAATIQLKTGVKRDGTLVAYVA